MMMILKLLNIVHFLFLQNQRKKITRFI